jgi:thiol-disulfide isomerase/thioredoxin
MNRALRGALLLGLLAGCRLGPARPGEPLPDGALVQISGGTIELQQLRGRVVVLNFWASWCPPCLEEIPTLEQLRLGLRAQPVTILPTNVEALSDVEVVGFLRRHGYQGPAYRDRRWRLAHRLGTFKLPETYIIRPDGKLERKIEGLPEPGWNDPRWVAYLTELTRPAAGS